MCIEQEILYTGCVVCRRAPDGENQGCEFCPDPSEWQYFPMTQEGAAAFVAAITAEGYPHLP